MCNTYLLENPPPRETEGVCPPPYRLSLSLSLSAMSAGGAQFKSREDQRRTRELEEARKAGTIPAERDADGNEINPHIPQVRRAVFWSREALRHGQNGKVRRVRNREWACSFVRLV